MALPDARHLTTFPVFHPTARLRQFFASVAGSIVAGMHEQMAGDDAEDTFRRRQPQRRRRAGHHIHHRG